jgi:hypothetical protein
MANTDVIEPPFTAPVESETTPSTTTNPEKNKKILGIVLGVGGTVAAVGFIVWALQPKPVLTGAYQQSQGAYQQSQGAYQQSQGGYQQSQGAYQQSQGGYSQGY